MKSVIQNTALLGTLLISASALAQREADYCRNGFFPAFNGQFVEAKVNSTSATVHFYDDSDGCPEKGTSCRTKAYLVPGNRVLVAQSKTGWRCVWYSGKKREFVSWLPSASLDLQPTTVTALPDWSGKWATIEGGSTLIISQKGNQLHVNGNTTWGAPDSPSVHIGEIDDDATVQGNQLIFGKPDSKDYECGGNMQLINGNLVVHDNGNCGGANVRFDSVYQRSKER